MMLNKSRKQISVYTYWQKRVLAPSIISATIVMLLAIFSFEMIDRTHQFNELKKIARSISQSIYVKIDTTKREEFSKIVYDVGSVHDVIITIDSPENENVASYPGVIELVDKTLPFDLVYQEAIQLKDGQILGQITVKKERNLSLRANELVLLIAVSLILMATLMWQLKFSRPMVSAINNLLLTRQINT